MHATAPLAESTRERLRRACASLDLAELSGSPAAMSQALAELARSHHELDSASSAESYLESAVRWARLCGSVDHLADLLCESADAAARVAAVQERGASECEASGSSGAPHLPQAERCRAAVHAARERARDRAFEVSQLAGRTSDASCEARWLLRVCDLLERCGDHADARQMQLRALNCMGCVAPRDPSLLSGFGRLADG